MTAIIAVFRYTFLKAQPKYEKRKELYDLVGHCSIPLSYFEEYLLRRDPKNTLARQATRFAKSPTNVCHPFHGKKLQRSVRAANLRIDG